MYVAKTKALDLHLCFHICKMQNFLMMCGSNYASVISKYLKLHVRDISRIQFFL